MDILEKIKKQIVYLDGGTGTLLQEAGLALGELPEEWNLSRPDDVYKINYNYFAAGADVVYANTFGANSIKFGERTAQIVTAGVAIARRAAAHFKDKYVALDIGSLGKLLKPLGGLDFEDAVNIFKTTVKAGADAGADLVVIETMNDIYEAKAAILAVKEVCNLPVFVTMVFGEDAKTMTGASPEAAVAILEGLGVDALGINCSLAPRQMRDIAARMIACASVPVIVKPNAGLPEERDGKTVYNLSAEDFAADMAEIADLGVSILGGCCGTTPLYIAELIAKTKGKFKPVQKKNITAVASYTHAVTIGDIPVLIGERINPTGKKRLKQALKENDMAYILGEAVAQAEKGAHILDVNVGLPEIDEPAVLERAVCEIQSVTDLPLQIDTSDPVAMERALRRYNGKALVNSVNGKVEIMQAVFPLVKKYGGAVICLTLDEDGIPETAEGRVKIAKKIITYAKKYGIEESQLIFDPLAMAVSADGGAALAALGAIKTLTDMGCHTSLGVSNISFGLPNRDFINGTFFACALSAGLKAAIINPDSQEMIKTYRAYLALSGKDKNCLGYIEYASSVQAEKITQTSAAAQQPDEQRRDLHYYIVKGIKDEAAAAADKLLKTLPPMEVINGYIIPALNEVGDGFEKKTIFLPQLLMSAEASAAAFEVIKTKFSGGGEAKKTKIVIATVKGDIHDIGKNIVKTLLENYGFKVFDLGRDVPPEVIVDKAIEERAQIVALSALMTTTVSSMRDTIALLKQRYPECKTVVGGAVLTAEYAKSIGADAYGKDAMETVRFAESVENSLL